ncbi:hypothetical protein AAU01_11960 [Paenarthrobacter aurescens]|uniref:Uncharacterized protein n=1 Tax=Paenarthrobacter aurescens TaxID=43663 RepID=A0A4Y3NH76_PAEAU|nr:hypothetical protein AAU01_11960 [Paenarthrobacter aurescens]
MQRRKWCRFRVLPFRRGVTYAAGDPIGCSNLEEFLHKVSDLFIICRSLEKGDGLTLDYGNCCGNSLNLEGLRQLGESVNISCCKYQTATVALNYPLGGVKNGG